MKRPIACLMLLFLSFKGSSQKRILLDSQLSNPHLEYSALCKLGSRILLLPQFPEKGIIYGIDSMDVLTFLTRGFPTTPSTQNWQVKGLDDIRNRIKEYEGFEAATHNNGLLYCTIETGTNNDTCYLIRGLVKEDTIEFDMHNMLALLKRKRLKLGYNISIDNAGFECLTYVQQIKKLLVLFEYNNYPRESRAFLVDTNFTSIDTLNLQSIDFRLTDICEGNDKYIYAINHHYHGDYAAYEPDTVINKNGKPLNWKLDDYTSVVKLELKKNGYIIRPVCTISPAGDNWEGIIPFYKGFLLVTDLYPGSKLVYYPIKAF